jgi:hypothetical protein
MEDELIVNDFVLSEIHPYLLRVYRVIIISSKANSIWYADKKGMEYDVMLACKIVSDGLTAVFRVIKLSEDGLTVVDPVILLDIYPVDCKIINESFARSKREFKYFTLG